MFTRARLRIALLYASLMGLTLALVAAGIVTLGARQTRHNDDLGLRLRAESLAAPVARWGELRPPRPPSRNEPNPPGGPSSSRAVWEQQRRLAGEGIIDHFLPVTENRVGSAAVGSVSGLPNVEAAQAAVDTGSPQYRNLQLDDGEVRLYSLPVSYQDRTVAVVQVARSRYFVDAAVTQLLLLVLGLGATGLVFSGVTGYWLAGRTLRPIAGAMERQRRFTADASHELRTPLALVRGNAELLLRHPRSRIAAYEDVVQDIVDESDRLTRLVTDLLTLARADEGHPQLARTQVDLAAIGAALVRRFEPLAAAKALMLRAEITPNITVWGDADRLNQLGSILLENAVRYTVEGEVVLRIAADARGALLAVSDTGVGIAPDHLPHLFERFYRTDASRSSEEGGAGLGLAIARWIAEAHGGSIDVTSTPGAGSTFAVHLPRIEHEPASGVRSELEESHR